MPLHKEIIRADNSCGGRGKSQNLFEKENPTQKLMFMLNHWSSKILP